MECGAVKFGAGTNILEETCCTWDIGTCLLNNMIFHPTKFLSVLPKYFSDHFV